MYEFFFKELITIDHAARLKLARTAVFAPKVTSDHTTVRVLIFIVAILVSMTIHALALHAGFDMTRQRQVTMTLTTLVM